MSRHNHLMRFERPLHPEDDWNSEDSRWQQVSDQFVGLKALSGRELVEAAQRHADVTHMATCHFSEGIKTDMRARSLEQTDRVFGILAAYDPDDRKRQLQLLLVERT